MSYLWRLAPPLCPSRTQAAGNRGEYVMSSKYYLPKGLEDLLEKTKVSLEEREKPLIPERLQACKNLGLILDKYPPKTAIGVGEGKNSWLKALMPNKHIDIELAK